MSLTDKYLWVEKYRPHKLDDAILPDTYKKSFAKYIMEKDIPQLLLLGIQGSGKTTIARILCEEVLSDPDDCLMLNGSTMNGVDVVRDHVEEFLRTPPLGDTNIKIVFYDEFDYVSLNAQAALRNMSEKYSDHNRFILTANYKTKIMDAIHSRFTTYSFKKLPKDYVQKYCYNILDSENIKYDSNFVDKTINSFYPDIRKIVNTLQGKVDGGSDLIADYDSIISAENMVRSYISDMCIGIVNFNQQAITKSLTESKSILANDELDFNSLYSDLFNDDSIPMWAKIIINKYSNGNQTSMIPGMHFIAMMYEIIESGTMYMKMRR